MKIIKDGVCKPKGFKAAGVHCGIRKNTTKKDLALIYSETKAAAAAVYTTNKVKGAPLLVTQKHLEYPYARAIICNSGNANTCNPNGVEIAEETCLLVSQEFSIPKDEVLVASTGVIGQPLFIAPIAKGINLLADELSNDSGTNAAQAIMTTDTIIKEAATEFTLGDKNCSIGAMAKGSGMINPNMATMLAFITTDVAISPSLLNQALQVCVENSFNMVSVDGDTSTNDMVIVLANGMADNEFINDKNSDYQVFKDALQQVTLHLAKLIAKDGEGATKLLKCQVTGADSEISAKKIAKTVISSSLVKTAIFGEDANWGRIICAVGYSGTDINPEQVDIMFSSDAGSIIVCESGFGIAFDEEKAKAILSQDQISIMLKVGEGDYTATAWGCDLTYDYVRINGDYRT